MTGARATRGRTYGFRFLLHSEFKDRLPVYDKVFSGIEDGPEAWHRVEDKVALRFPDPLNGRTRPAESFHTNLSSSVPWPMGLSPLRMAVIWSGPWLPRSGTCPGHPQQMDETIHFFEQH
jgi:hypothetical protein